MSLMIDITKPPYHADNTGIVDASRPLMEAIQDLGSGRWNTLGGKIFMPAGVYKFEKTVDVTSYVIIEGEGGQHFQYWPGNNEKDKGGSTIIVPDLGVTAFRFWAGDAIHKDSPKGTAQRSVIRDLVISRNYKQKISDDPNDPGEVIRRAYYNESAVGDLEKGVIGHSVGADKSSRKITNFSPPNDFQLNTWQLISIGGAGPEVKLTGIAADVKRIDKNVSIPDDPNNPSKTMTEVDFMLNGPKPAIYEGAYVKIIGAGIKIQSEIVKVGVLQTPPEPDKPPVSYFGFTIQYENEMNNIDGAEKNNPIPGAKECEVILVSDLLARVTEIKNKEVFVDTHEDFHSGISLFKLKIRHADAGIDMMARARCENILVYGMRGPAFAVIADNQSIPHSNAINFQIEHCLVHDCEYALYILGRDTSDGTTINFSNLVHVNPLELIESGIEKFVPKWGIADLSFFGNAHIAPHFSGGHGAISRGGGTNRSVFIRIYHEKGTISFFGETTTAIGGELRYDQGGHSWSDGIFSDITVGKTRESTAFSSYERLFHPKHFLERYRSADSTDDYTFRKTHIGDGAAGWYGHVYEGQGNWGVGEIAFCWSDKGADGGPAQFWAPGGIQVGGRLSNGKIGIAEKRTLTFGSAPPEIGAWKQGDIIFNIGATSGGTSFWQCTSSGRPGTWVAHTL